MSRSKKFIGLLSFAIAGLAVHQSAFALIPPWWMQTNLLRATVGANPCVKIGDPEEIPGHGFGLVVQACSTEVATALATVLKTDVNALTVRFLDQNGVEAFAKLPADATAEQYREQYELALAGNVYFAAVSHRRAMRTSFSVELRPEVVQIHSDNISDPYLNSNFTAQQAFSMVLKETLPNAVRVGFTTVPKR